jgi:c(7)-type cytochrome triheme protein
MVPVPVADKLFSWVYIWWFLITSACGLWSHHAWAFYGDTTMNRTAGQFGAPPVVFPHWIHRIEFRCSVCHPDIFQMRAGAHSIMMERMVARGTFCATCHNGTIAWRPVNCHRCHRTDDRLLAASDPDSTTLPEPGPPFAKDNRDPDTLLRSFPHDASGMIDWVEAVRSGLIAPRSTPRSNGSTHEEEPSDVLMVRTGSMPAVRFPHSSHALWLECRNCHTGIFVPKKGANAMSMAQLQAGQYCGRCHGKVSFPLSECGRCHRP